VGNLNAAATEPAHVEGAQLLKLERILYPAAAMVVARTGRREELARQLGSHTGLVVADGPEAVSDPDHMVWGMAPGHWLVFGKRERSGWLTALGEAVAASGSVFDQCSASAMWRLSGGSGAVLLQKGLFIDLDPARFRAGSCCTGLLAHVAVTVARVDEAVWELAAPCSYSGHVQHWLEIASANAGIPLQWGDKERGSFQIEHAAGSDPAASSRSEQ
jgi:heterotetrameric sarcosine oxidase gamma subunit